MLILDILPCQCNLGVFFDTVLRWEAGIASRFQRDVIDPLGPDRLNAEHIVFETEGSVVAGKCEEALSTSEMPVLVVTDRIADGDNKGA